jgi:para-nitrobenzyl esterase
MSQAWVNFARTGDPSHPGLPAWPRHERAGGAVMIFDDDCHVKSHPDAEVRRLVYGS